MKRRRPCIAKKIGIHRSKISRLGIFAGENIKKGEYIFTTRDRAWDYLLKINHSCKPNARLTMGKDDDHDMLFAIKKIKPGQEITMDYRKTRWAQEYFYNRIIKRYGGCRCPSCASKQKHKINLLKE